MTGKEIELQLKTLLERIERLEAEVALLKKEKNSYYDPVELEKALEANNRGDHSLMRAYMKKGGTAFPIKRR